jgi:hypothetical protein
MILQASSPRAILKVHDRLNRLQIDSFPFFFSYGMVEGVILRETL